ncbi:MAG: WG repeat-containing protein [Bacteroidetes bacterium]|nr:WG repeat-containing protein [Bacteroidota bacterium]
MKTLMKTTLLLVLIFIAQNLMGQAEVTISGLKPEEFKPVVLKVLSYNNYNVTNCATNIETDWKEYTVNMVFKYRAKLSFTYLDGSVKISILYKQAWVDPGQWGDATIPSKKADEKMVNSLADAIKKIIADPAAMSRIVTAGGAAPETGGTSSGSVSTSSVSLTTAAQGVTKGTPHKPSTANAKELRFYADGDYVFHEGYCALKKNDLWGFIDTLGNVVIDFKYFSWQGLTAPYFSSGIALVSVKEGTANVPKYLDKKGQELFKTIKLVGGTQFESGIALFGKGNSSYTAAFSFVNKQGQPIVGAVPNTTSFGVKLLPFHEGVAMFHDGKTSSVGFINTQAKWAIQPGKYNDAGEFSEGLAPVQNKTNWYWGYINTKGEEKIAFDYKTKPGNFSEGLAAVKNSAEDVGYIDQTGKTVIPFNFNGYQKNGDFKNGHAVVYRNNKGYEIIDKAGNTVKKLNSTVVKVQKNGWITWYWDLGTGYDMTWGILSPEGNEILAPGYFKYIGEFSNGVAWAEADIDEKPVKGFINKNFDFIVIQQTE